MRTGPEFEEFVRASSPALLRTACALVGDRGHAEDMLQTALLRTARRWPAARTAPEAYARQVLVNLCRDHWRWLRRRPPETLLADQAGRDAADPLAGPAELAGQRLSLLPALMRLPDRQRHVIVLRFLDDLSVAETAALLGISPGTVKSYTARALSQLRAALDEGPAAPSHRSPEVFHAH
ncbi:MAG TPA: SigE family RNA polymerase sigma factor [Streptosporangiaceae bacterium]